MFVLLADNLFGQIISIEYAYKEKLDLSQYKNKLPPQVSQVLFASNSPIIYSKSYLLRVDKNKSSFKPKDSIPDDIEFPYEGGTIKIHSIEFQTNFFIDKDNQLLLGTIPYRGKMMNIHDTIPFLCWDITNNKKSILGYPATKAVLEFCNRSIEAWFTTDIPVQAGPLFYGGLPGLILELSIDDDFKHYQAINILNDIKNDSIIKEFEHRTTEYLQLSDYCTY